MRVGKTRTVPVTDMEGEPMEGYDAEANSPAATTQPPPQGDGAEVLPLVMADLQARAAAGRRKYGTPLRAHNGRGALMDAYQEVLDLAMYLRQALEENDCAECNAPAPAPEVFDLELRCDADADEGLVLARCYGDFAEAVSVEMVAENNWVLFGADKARELRDWLDAWLQQEGARNE